MNKVVSKVNYNICNIELADVVLLYILKVMASNSIYDFFFRSRLCHKLEAFQHQSIHF